MNAKNEMNKKNKAVNHLIANVKSLVLSVTAHPDYILGKEGDEWHDLISMVNESLNELIR
jgi:hypothetical protein